MKLLNQNYIDTEETEIINYQDIQIQIEKKLSGRLNN